MTSIVLELTDPIVHTSGTIDYHHPSEIQLGDLVRLTTVGWNNLQYELHQIQHKSDTDQGKQFLKDLDAFNLFDGYRVDTNDFAWEVINKTIDGVVRLQARYIPSLQLEVGINQIRALDDYQDEKILFHPGVILNGEHFYIASEAYSKGQNYFLQNGFNADVIRLNRPPVEDAALVEHLESLIAGEPEEVRDTAQYICVRQVTKFEIEQHTSLDALRAQVMDTDMESDEE